MEFLMKLDDRIPENVSISQRWHAQRELDRTACMMVDWFADRAFTCPDSLPETIETYKGLIVANVHAA
jgi:hypothetical protein